MAKRGPRSSGGTGKWHKVNSLYCKPESKLNAPIGQWKCSAHWTTGARGVPRPKTKQIFKMRDMRPVDGGHFQDAKNTYLGSLGHVEVTGDFYCRIATQSGDGYSAIECRKRGDKPPVRT